MSSGSSGPLLPPSIPPIIADRYRIDARLGSGGMGDVFRAHDRTLKRAVALKVLREAENPGGDAGTFRQLLREARLCAALQHPNIVTIFDVGVSGGIAFIAMELVEGNNLRVAAQNPAATTDEKLGWLRDVASALEAAHNVGLVHRDIKPENVIVKKDGAVKVLDFGIAKWSAAAHARSMGYATASETTGPVFAGTPGYMPPEQRMGQVDERSDQYAWGVLAYEVLSGARAPRDRPLTGADIEQALPKEIAPLVERATSYRAEERFPSVRALLDLLPATTITAGAEAPRRKSVEQATETWMPNGRGAGKEKRGRRKSALVFASATVITIVGVGVAGGVLYRLRWHRAASASDTNTETSTSPSTSTSSIPSLPVNAVDGGLTDEDLATSPSPTTSASSPKEPLATRPPVLLGRVPGHHDELRTITVTGFGLGAFTNAQAHRVCEKHRDGLQRCVAADQEGARSFDVIRTYALFTSAGVVGTTGIQWHPTESGGSRLLGCVGNEINGQILAVEAGPPERGWPRPPPKNAAVKHVVGCEIKATPKASPPPTSSDRPTAPAQISDASAPAPTPWPSHEIKGKVARINVQSAIAASYLAPEELARWGKIVGPRMVPCFNLPRGDCNADLALLELVGGAGEVTRLWGLDRIGPAKERACEYPKEVVECVKSAAGSEHLHAKGNIFSHYTVELHLVSP